MMTDRSDLVLYGTELSGHTHRVVLRLWVSYTPTGGKHRKRAFYGLRLPDDAEPRAPRPQRLMVIALVLSGPVESRLAPAAGLLGRPQKGWSAYGR